MAYTDLIRSNEGMPQLPDLSGRSAEEQIAMLYTFVRQQQDYIVRLKEQIGFELKRTGG